MTPNVIYRARLHRNRYRNNCTTCRPTRWPPAIRCSSRYTDRMNSITAPPAPPTPRLLDQLRAAARARHYALSTEKAYVHWARAFIRFHGLRHPREMGAAEVESFLSYLANDRCVSPATRRRALAGTSVGERPARPARAGDQGDLGRPGVSLRGSRS